MSVDNSLRFACDVVSGDQLSENSLELLAADEGSPDMIQADVPFAGTRQKMAEDALGLDRKTGGPQRPRSGRW